MKFLLLFFTTSLCLAQPLGSTGRSYGGLLTNQEIKQKKGAKINNSSKDPSKPIAISFLGKDTEKEVDASILMEKLDEKLNDWIALTAIALSGCEGVDIQGEYPHVNIDKLLNTLVEKTSGVKEDPFEFNEDGEVISCSTLSNEDTCKKDRKIILAKKLYNEVMAKHGHSITVLLKSKLSKEFKYNDFFRKLMIMATSQEDES